MNRRSGRVSAAIVLCLTLAALLPCLALENQHSEDFTTTLYEDAVNTTADWNTAAGELQKYIAKISGKTLEITQDTARQNPALRRLKKILRITG